MKVDVLHCYIFEPLLLHLLDSLITSRLHCASPLVTFWLIIEIWFLSSLLGISVGGVFRKGGYRELGDCLVRMWPGLPRFQVFIFVGDQRSQCTSDPLLALRRNRKLTCGGFRDFVQPLQKQIVQLFMLELRIRSQNVGGSYLLWFCTFSFCVFDIFPIWALNEYQAAGSLFLVEVCRAGLLPY